MKPLVAILSLATLAAAAGGCGAASPPPPVAPGPVPTFTNTAAVPRTGGTRHPAYVFTEGAVSTDGRLLYMPDGELSSDGNWYIISTRNGRVLGKIGTPGTGPHDGVVSADGRILQLGDRNYSRLLIYDTRAHKLVGETAQL